MPADEYRAIEAVSISRLKELRRSALHYRYALTNPKDTEPLRLGTASHCAVLEPERFERQFAVWQRRTEGGNMAPRRGQHWEAFEKAHAGREILTEQHAELALAVALAVRNDPVALPYLISGEPEVVMQWKIGERACKGRVDWLTRMDGEPVIVGLKTARDCRPFIFGAAAAKLDYALQWAWYFNGYAAIKGGERPRMVEIVVESAPPHAVVVYRIPDDILLQGEENYQELLRALEKCEASGEWPGPNTEEQVLTLPSWYYPTDDDISDMGLVA
jgi:hypothetical protein